MFSFLAYQTPTIPVTTATSSNMKLNVSINMQKYHLTFQNTLIALILDLTKNSCILHFIKFIFFSIILKKS